MSLGGHSRLREGTPFRRTLGEESGDGGRRQEGAPERGNAREGERAGVPSPFLAKQDSGVTISPCLPKGHSGMK